jgi:hypothetical protein
VRSKAVKNPSPPTSWHTGTRSLEDGTPPSLLVVLDYLDLLAELKPQTLAATAVRWHGRLEVEAAAMTLAVSQIALAASRVARWVRRVGEHVICLVWGGDAREGFGRDTAGGKRVSSRSTATDARRPGCGSRRRRASRAE